MEISKALKIHIQRNDDSVFRLSGEEFAGVILSQNKDKTHKQILSLCKLIEDLKIEYKESSVSESITVSIGVSAIKHSIRLKRVEETEASLPFFKLPYDEQLTCDIPAMSKNSLGFFL